MSKLTTVGGRAELRRQSRIIRALGSPFTARILDAAERQLEAGPRTAALIAGWPGDAAAAALGLRLNSAIQALARRGNPATLAALYQQDHDDFDSALASALRAEDAFICKWVQHPTQTNEVARAGAIAAALMALRRQADYPVELLEIGSSCGLNLNLMHYAHDLGGVAVGDPASHVRIAPEWRGRPLEPAPITLVSARGADLNPLDPCNGATRERLLAYVWADKPARAERLECALQIAQRIRPQVVAADAVNWLVQQLAAPQEPGVCRVIVHSMVIQYLTPGDRLACDRLIAAAMARATPDRPVARIAFEWTAAATKCN